MKTKTKTEQIKKIFEIDFSRFDLAVFFKMMSMMTGAVFAGWTINHFNEDFLNEFTKPHFQFLILLFVAMGIHEFNLKSFKFMIIDALIFTIILNIIKKLTDNYKSKTDDKESKTHNRNHK